MKKADIKPWTLLNTETALQTPWFSISKNSMRTAAGQNATYWMHHAPDTVICFCLTEDNKILIERQYRPPIQRISLDFPAGGIEPSDKNPAEAMLRELKEETGFEPAELTPLGILDVWPGFSAGRVHVFLARGALKHRSKPEQTEAIHIEFVTPEALIKLIEGGKICCSPCVATTFMAFKKMGWLRFSYK